MSLLSDKMKALDEETGGELGQRIMELTKAVPAMPMPTDLPGAFSSTPKYDLISLRVMFMLAGIQCGDWRPRSPRGMRTLKEWADGLVKIALEK